MSAIGVHGVNTALLLCSDLLLGEVEAASSCSDVLTGNAYIASSCMLRSGAVDRASYNFNNKLYSALHTKDVNGFQMMKYRQYIMN